MKKWLIVLSIIFGVSAITAAVTGGHAIFNTTETVYEDNGTQALNKQALKSVYVRSSIPVEVYPTTGEPRVEYTQKSTNFIKNFPKYELSVTEKEDKTYIDLNQVEHSLWVGHARNDAYLTLYLPEGAIEHLDIYSRGYNSYNRMHTVDLKNIDVKNLNLDFSQKVTFYLDGNYNRVSIGSYNYENTLNMVSHSPATVSINGNIVPYLEGQYEKVTIENCNAEISIRSQTPCQVAFKNCEQAEIDLKGSYSSVTIDGYDQMINLDSNIECRLSILGGDNTLYANGPFKIVDLNGYDSIFEVQSTIVPRNIQMGNKMNSKAKLILPSNIPGFVVNSNLPYDSDVAYSENYMSLILNNAVKSDFKVTYQMANGQNTLQYGDGTTKINLDVANYEDFSLELIDGGYDVALS